MDFDELLNKMNAQMYSVVKDAVELGKWPDGQRLDTEQKRTCVRVLIAYENKHLNAEQRSGYMPAKQACTTKQTAAKADKDSAKNTPLKWH